MPGQLRCLDLKRTVSGRSHCVGVLLLGLLALGPGSLWADRFLGVPREDIQEVMDLGYNLDPRTSGLIDQIIEDYPESPMGLCLKAARLFRLDDYAEGTDEDVSDQFQAASDIAIEVSKDYYNRNPQDPEVRYALAMCELNLARYYIDHGRWLSGFFKATSGLGHLKAILKEHPDFHDAKMPLGVANCFLDKTPAYLKPLAALLRFSGNMELGLQQLEDAETKGFLTRYESLYYQVSVQWILLEDKETAAEILDRFIERFPRNVDAVAMRSHLDRKRERFAEAFEGYQYILSLPEISYLGEMRDWVVLHSGNLAIQLEKPEIGLEKGLELLESVEQSRKELRAWAQVLYANSLLHLGRRDEASEQFAKVRRRDNPDAFKATTRILEEMARDQEAAQSVRVEAPGSELEP